jgi:hypothetical protein
MYHAEGPKLGIVPNNTVEKLHTFVIAIHAAAA